MIITVRQVNVHDHFMFQTFFLYRDFKVSTVWIIASIHRISRWFVGVLCGEFVHAGFCQHGRSLSGFGGISLPNFGV